MPTQASRTSRRAGRSTSRQTEPKAAPTTDSVGTPDVIGRAAGAAAGAPGAAIGGVIGWFLSLLPAAVAVAGRSTRKRAPDSPGTGSTRPIRPPCRSVTQRAIARPSPVPPPAVSGSVPNRTNTRSRSSGAIPVPSSVTSSRTTSPTRPAQMRTTPPSGLCRAALSSRLASSWWSRDRSASTTRPGGSTRTSKDTPRIPAWASVTASPTSAETGTGLRSRATTPASTRERSRRSLTRLLSRCAWPSATRIVAGSGSVTPSSRFSSTATSAVSGVRSSCETLATRSRRWRSTVARSAAIRLNVRASSPTSSVEEVSTRTS